MEGMAIPVAGARICCSISVKSALRWRWRGVEANMAPTEGANAMAKRLGIMFDGFDTTADMVETVRRAEDVGADSVWIAEHMGYREAVTCAAAFATATSRIRLIPTAISPYMWHPVPTAMSLATLAELAPGRAGVAVAVGNLLNLKESGHEPVTPVRAT